MTTEEPFSENVKDGSHPDEAQAKNADHNNIGGTGGSHESCMQLAIDETSMAGHPKGNKLFASISINEFKMRGSCN